MKFKAIFAGFLFLSLAVTAAPWNYSGTGDFQLPYGYGPTNTGVRPIEATVSTNPAHIQLKILTFGTYDIYRKLAGATSWGSVITNMTVMTGQQTWTDTNVVAGQLYEYRVLDGDCAGYLLSGIEVDQTLPKGRLALVVTTDIKTNIPSEYAQYKADLVADGWIVHEIEVPRAEDYTSNGTGAADTNGVPTAPFPSDHITVRNQIISLYTNYPGELKDVVLLGKVPVARSGTYLNGPDGHGNRAATGADAYYADMDGVWTDTGDNLSKLDTGSGVSVSEGTINIPGDNKFDAAYLSAVGNGSVELGFGRIDLSSKIPSEYDALKMYFSKLHRYKTASPDFLPGRRAAHRALYEQVSINMLMSMPGVVGMTNVDCITSSDLPISLGTESMDADSAYSATNGPYLFYFKGSSHPRFSEGGRAVFWTGFQSFWGYWYEMNVSSGANEMQLRLAEDNFTLSYTWSAGVYLCNYYLYQRMGMGFDAGDMMRVSISEKSAYSTNKPTMSASKSSYLFMNHMGDPTLRLFMFPPPTGLSVVPSGGHPSLSWIAARAPAAGEPQVIGYHVYRSSAAEGPFTRITSAPVDGTNYLDSTVSSGLWYYMVKSVRLETTGAGSYYNVSLGIQQSIDLTGGPATLAVVTDSLPEANWNTGYQTSLTATGGTPVFAWSVISGALPPGLTLSTAGSITGKVTAAGTYSFTVQAADRLGQTAQKALSITAQSSDITTFVAEANQYLSSYSATARWASYDSSLQLSGPIYLYQPFLRFDISGLNTNNGLVRARLILTLNESSQPNSYALVKAALTQDGGDNWDESTVVYTNRPLDDTTVAPVSATAFPVPYGKLELDVTPLVQATLANDSAKKVGLRLSTTMGSGLANAIRIAHRLASGDARPRLVIETTEAPSITITSPAVNPASLHAGSSLLINATATPIPSRAGALTVQWTQLSGSGTATFASAAQASTTVTFSAPGDYVLRLTANDGVLTSCKDLTVRVLSVPASTAPVTGPTDSLLMRLPLDETSGTTAADVSGVSPANSGTLATIGTNGIPTWITSGKIGGAMNFDGTGQRIEVADSTNTPLDGMQKLSASLWVNLNAADTNAYAILSKRTTSTASTTSYAITLTSAEKLSVSVANKTAATGDNILSTGQWYHVVMVYDGSLTTNNLQLYLNGSPEKFATITTGQTSNAIPRISGSPLRIGDYTATAVTASLNGQVDDVRLYNRALTLAEIQDLANAAPSNMGPTITLANSSVSGSVGQPVALGATITDDGLPQAVQVAWSKASGPGSVVFSAPVSSTTDVTTATAGSYGLRITADDGAITTYADVAADFATVGVNVAPIANNQTITMAENTSTGLVLTASDANGDILNYSILTPPAHGSLSGLNTNSGAVIYTPATDYFGADSFTFRVSDGTLSSTGTVSLTVTEVVFAAPVANDRNIRMFKNTSTNLVLTASDADSPNLTYSIGTSPAHGSLSGLNTNSGAVTYTPATDYSGMDNFTFLVSDGSLSSTGTVSLAVMDTGTSAAGNIVSVTNNLNSGRIGNNGVSAATVYAGDVSGVTNSGVLIFQLPAIPSGHKVIAANLRMFISAVETTAFGVDLYALRTNSVASITNVDYYAGSYGASAGHTPIMHHFIPYPASTNSPYTVTNTDSQAALADWVQAQYDAGAAGKYVYLGLSPSTVTVASNAKYRFNNYGSTGRVPLLTLTTADTNIIPTVFSSMDKTGFSAVAGGSDTAILTISNAATWTLFYGVSNGVSSWLCCPSETLSLAAGAVTNITVTANAAALGQGQYTGTLAVTYFNNSTTPNPTNFPVIFDVSSGSGGISSWRQLHFGTTENTGDAADTANPSGDGLRNLLKYALGLDPNVDYSNSPLVPSGQLEKITGQNYLTFTFTRDTSVSDVTISAEAVNDLNAASWESINPFSPSNQVEVLNDTPSSGIQTITVKDTQPSSAVIKRFMRLKVTRP